MQKRIAITSTIKVIPQSYREQLEKKSIYAASGLLGIKLLKEMTEGS